MKKLFGKVVASFKKFTANDLAGVMRFIALFGMGVIIANIMFFNTFALIVAIIVSVALLVYTGIIETEVETLRLELKRSKQMREILQEVLTEQIKTR